MVYQAIVKDGGVFIPNIDKKVLKKVKTRIDIVITNNEKGIENPIIRTSGILKGKIEDGLEYESKMRSEWRD